MSELEPQWLTNPSNGLAAAPSHPAWLSLYLSASKLLDLLLALPPHRLPQFQTYRWLFLGEGVAIPPSLMEPIWRRSNSEEATKETEDVKNPKEDYSEEKNQEKEKLSNNGMEFISHAEKLALALERKFPEPVHPLTFQVGKLMLVNRSLITLGDLKPFFITLARGRRYQQPMDPLVPEDDILKGIEENILRDFVEPCTY
ncbi:unnamed protein product [Cyprideis torosa]|uniref:Uncharacterized protein n=1 Tax=Cyprideis torosa TaxID=163714 RepID=A0A7R8ZZX5_9CRUS|nr:unnamed protein product [Cyprideis torosa]CAG0910183.1 unnamed protein product [Cyprideis torosa]